MSRLPGQVDWWPADMERWLRRLAGLLPAIHAAPMPPVGVLRPFTSDPQASYRPPGWARYPRVWEQAAIGFLDDLRDDPGSEPDRVEDMLARAVAELGGSCR
jgi:hypothetical protein